LVIWRSGDLAIGKALGAGCFARSLNRQIAK